MADDSAAGANVAELACDCQPLGETKTASQQELKFLVDGCHPNPTELLGRRLVDGQVVLRVWIPGASGVTCIIQMGEAQAKAKLHRVEAAGNETCLFESSLQMEGIEDFSKWDYKLDVEWGAGGTCLRGDPYSFGTLLPEATLQGWAAGTSSEPVAASFGAHHMELSPGVWGTRFALWAPAAKAVSVVGDFNYWDGTALPMCPRSEFGVWELFLPAVSFEGLRGQKYGYKVWPKASGQQPSIRIDPFAQEFVEPAGGAHDAKVPWCDDYSRSSWNGTFAWSDETWVKKRSDEAADWEKKPLAFYEVHLSSWTAEVGADGKRLGYRELAAPLAAHCKKLGFNCVEFLPLSQYPCDGSWGYQCAGGMFAVDSRLGSPDDFRYLVNTLHENSIAVVVDFVGAHFAKDDWGLTMFAGEPQFEYEGPVGEIPGWGTARYNYAKPEVKAFLIGAVRHWIEQFHVDGFRLDAVAAMVYKNFGREEDGDAIIQGRGVVNEDGVKFLRELCSYVRTQHPGVLLSAEDSTNFKWITSRPVVGGTERQRVALEDLGFHMKWNMGFTYDTLAVCKAAPDARPGMNIFGHKQLSWFLQYAYNERWVLPLSHDNAQPKSLLEQMEGASEADRLGLLQVLLAYTVGMPGRPLFFMGTEIGEGAWSYEKPIDWAAAGANATKSRLMSWTTSLLKLYQEEPALHAGDDEQDSFKWLDCDNSNRCIFSWQRSAKDNRTIVVVTNFSKTSVSKYEVPMPKDASGMWRCAACSMSLSSGSALPTAPVRPGSGLIVQKLDALTAQIWLSPAPVRITFELRHPSAKDDCSIRVVGGSPLLGNWKAEEGLLCEHSPDSDLWTAEVDVPPSLGNLEFKFLTIDGTGAVSWEPIDGNRNLQELWTTDNVHFSAEYGSRK